MSDARWSEWDEDSPRRRIERVIRALVRDPDLDNDQLAEITGATRNQIARARKRTGIRVPEPIEVAVRRAIGETKGRR